MHTGIGTQVGANYYTIRNVTIHINKRTRDTLITVSADSIYFPYYNVVLLLLLLPHPRDRCSLSV